MIKKFVLLMSMFLFLVVGSATAAPDSYQQYFASIKESGQVDGLTEKMLVFEETNETFIVEIKSDGSEIFQLIRPWGELVSIGNLIYNNNPVGGVDAASADFNGDGATDLIVCGTTTSLWLGDGNGNFSHWKEIIQECHGTDAGQIDGINNDDFVIATDDGVEVFIHTPSNPSDFNFAGTLGTGVYNDVALGLLSYTDDQVDLDIDLFAVTDSSEEVWQGNGNGSFSLDSSQPALVNGGNKVVLEDYDLDGDSDVFVVSIIFGHAFHNDNGLMASFIIPNFSHASFEVIFGFFDDEEGLDILFIGDTRAWFYTGIALQDWGQEFIPGSSGVSVDMDGDGDDDFIIGRKGQSNIAFKGGPIRTVFTQEDPSLSTVLETGQSGYLDSHLSFSGNGPRQWTMECTESWLTCDSEGDYGPTFTGASWTAIVDATGLPAGIHNGTVTIITNDPEREEILVPVQVVVTAAEITVNTTSIIETVGINGQKTVDLSVSNTGTAGVWVTPSDDSNWISFVTAPFFLMPGESKTLAVTLTGASENGTVNGQIFLTTNKTYLTPIEIQVSLTTTGFQIFLPMVVKP